MEILGKLSSLCFMQQLQLVKFSEDEQYLEAEYKKE